MTYTVLRDFHDLTDFKQTKSGKLYHFYKAGDEYPRKGLNPKQSRIAELLGDANAQGTPIISESFNLAEHMTPPDEAGNEAIEQPPVEKPKKKRTTRKKKAVESELMPGA